MFAASSWRSPRRRARECGKFLQKVSAWESQHLEAASVVDRHSQGHHHGDDVTGRAGLHTDGVQPQAGPVALHGGSKKRPILSVDLSAQLGDLAAENRLHLVIAPLGR